VTLAPGTRLAHYEVLEPIGKGGMGEVYRARDSKLDRDVAIKVLPEELAGEPDRLARFNREAKVLASLNHPNIASIYGFEASEGQHYLVLELVPGETLAERIGRGPIPFEDARAIAIQIADALDEAHERGIIHRDLKPANVKLTPTDDVKVLDFGLAKALAEEPSETDASSSMSPTITKDATRIGVILGTAAYMSPEQAKGKSVDRRTDLFAFGSVLFEMLSGKKAFPGDDVSDVLASVIKLAPDWKALPRETPRRVREMLRRCLAKDPKQRRRDIADIRLELEGLDDAPAEIEPERSRERRWLTTVAVFIAAIAAIAVLAALDGWRSEEPELVTYRLSVLPPEGTRFASSFIALSRDGRRLAFAAVGEDGVQSLWVRALSSPTARKLPGTEGAEKPFWSHDGASVGFVSGDALRAIALDGAAPLTICEVQGFRGAAWHADGTILFSQDGSDGGLFRVTSSGDAAVHEARLLPGETYRTSPQFLSDGPDYLYRSVGGDEGNGIYVGVLGSADNERVVGFERASSLSKGMYARDGYLLYVRENAFLAHPFDAGSRRLTGEPQRLSDLGEVRGAGEGFFAVADGGVFAYRPFDRPAVTQPTWFDRSGTVLGTVGAAERYAWLELSPDEQQIAVERGRDEVWLLDESRGTSTLLSGEFLMAAPLWSADGSKILHMAARPGPSLYVTPASGGSSESLLKDARVAFPTDWSRDGAIAFTTGSFGSDVSTWILPDDGGAPLPFVRSGHAEQGKFSPDGKLLAYVTNESGRREVFVAHLSSGESRLQISSDGGAHPRWREDGREIFYLAPDGGLMSVAFRSGEALEAKRPHLLFRDPRVAHRAFRPSPYDVSGDGERFLVNIVVEEPVSPPITVVINWTAELSSP